MYRLLVLAYLSVSSSMIMRALRQGPFAAGMRAPSARRIATSTLVRFASDDGAAAAPFYIEDGAILLGDIIKDSTADGMAILRARDEAQMTGNSGDLLDFGEGRQGFVVWARPPIYFVQVLPDESSGVVPTIEGSCDVRLPLLPDVDLPVVKQTLTREAASPAASAVGGAEAEAEAEVAEKEKEAIAHVLQISTGAQKMGRITDFLDRPLDGLGPLDEGAKSLPVFNAEPMKGSTESLSRSLATGVMAVDVLTPLGRGQTMLVAGPNGVGRGELALDTVQAQSKGEAGSVACVWACLRGQGKEIAEKLAERGALENTAILEAPAGSPASVQFATAAAALAVAEGFRNEGGDSLVVLDDVSNLSSFWDDTTRVLLDEYGTDRADMGGDSEMRGFYSSLLQRNAQLKSLYGGGSMSTLVMMDEDNLATVSQSADEADRQSSGTYTLEDFDGPFFSNKTRARMALLVEKGIAITDEVCDKIGVPRPSVDIRSGMLATMHIDQLISLSDGHIMLVPELLATGQSPPLDPAKSLTRIGVGTAGQKSISSSVHSKAIRKVTSRLRLELASLADIRFNTNTKADVDAIANRAFAWQAALSQTTAAPMSLADQVLRLIVVEAGLLDDLVGKKLQDVVQGSNEDTSTSVLPDDALRAAAITEVRSTLDALSAHVAESKAGAAALNKINETDDAPDSTIETMRDIAAEYISSNSMIQK